MRAPWAIDPARVPAGGRATLNLYLNWLVVVLAFSLPLYRKWVSIAVPLVFLLWLLEGGLRPKLERLRRHRLTLAIVAFIALNLVSLLWCSDPVAGLEYVSKYRYLLLVPVIATSLRPEYRRPAAAAWAAGTVLSVVLVLLAASGILPQLEANPQNPAVSMSHLDLSMVLAVAALLGLNHLLSSSTSRRERVLTACFTAASFVGLLVNIGRSGQLAFFGALLIALPHYLNGRRWRKLAVAVVIVGVVLAAGYWAAPAFHRRLNAAVDEVTAALRGEDYSSNQGKRVATFFVAAAIFEEHPLLGTGVVDNMSELRRLLDGRFVELEATLAWVPHMHNQYLQVLTELGLVGLAALLAIFVALVREGTGSREQHTALLMLACAYLLGFLGDPYFHKQLPVALFATVVGVLLAPGLSLWKERDVSASLPELLDQHPPRGA